MEEIGQIQRWGIFFLGIAWGTLAILISASYFFCEYFPKRCERGVDKFRSLFRVFHKRKTR